MKEVRKIVSMIYHHLQSADKKTNFMTATAAVLVQTGSDDKLKKYHITSNGARHPGDKATEFSDYLSERVVQYYFVGGQLSL